jgi:hypothetical protein
MDELMYEGVLILMEMRGYTQVGQTSFKNGDGELSFENRNAVADYALNSAI